jgi:hypothetical protein
MKAETGTFEVQTHAFDESLTIQATNKAEYIVAF